MKIRFVAVRDPWYPALMGLGMKGASSRKSDRQTDFGDPRTVGSQQFRAIFDGAPVGISLVDREGRYVAVNPARQRMLGYTEAELVGRSYLEVTHPDDLEYDNRVNAEARRLGQDWYQLEKRFVRKDGQPYWTRITVSVVRDVDGEPEYSIVVAEDISDWKNATQRLHVLAEAGRILSSSLDHEATLASIAPVVVPAIADWCIVDVLEPDGSLRQVGVAHIDSSKECVIRELRRRFPPDRSTPHPLWRTVQTGESELAPEITDADLVAFGNSEESLALLRELGISGHIVVPLVARERILGTLSLVAAGPWRSYGVEDLALAQELARRAAIAVDNALLYRDSQEAVRLREEFMSIASHELKTPLTALQLQLQILQRSANASALAGLPNDKLERTLSVINRQMQRFRRLVNELLDESQIAAGQLNLDIEEIDLVSLISEVVERFATEAASVGSEISVETPASLVGRWDGYKLEQVITNLLSNAIKYGRGQPIRVALECVSGWAKLSVADEGVGIAASEVDIVFERFSRLSSGRRLSGGLGLGLYITRQIVHAHGGTIRVTSEPERGTTFTLELPC